VLIDSVMKLNQSQIDKSFANFDLDDREIMVILGENNCAFFVQGTVRENLDETRRENFADFSKGYNWAASVKLEHQPNFHLASDYANWSCHF
jgi:hypothetical protein